MNRLGLCLAVLSAGLVAGCAGTGGGSRLVKRDLSHEVDEEKIATVNEWARTHGAVVTWINKPVKVHGGDADEKK